MGIIRSLVEATQEMVRDPRFAGEFKRALPQWGGGPRERQHLSQDFRSDVSWLWQELGLDSLDPGRRAKRRRRVP